MTNNQHILGIVLPCAVVVVVGMYIGIRANNPHPHPHPAVQHHNRACKMIHDWWKSLQDRVHKHQRTYHRAHAAVHLGYFTAVFTHGPYNWVAGILLLIGVLGWILHLEDSV